MLKSDKQKHESLALFFIQYIWDLWERINENIKKKDPRAKKL